VTNDFAGPLQSAVNPGFFVQAFKIISKTTAGRENFSILNFGEYGVDIFGRFA